jgi:hypothetical protein
LEVVCAWFDRSHLEVSGLSGAFKGVRWGGTNSVNYGEDEEDGVDRAEHEQATVCRE